MSAVTREDIQNQITMIKQALSKLYDDAEESRLSNDWEKFASTNVKIKKAQEQFNLYNELLENYRAEGEIIGECNDQT